MRFVVSEIFPPYQNFTLFFMVVSCILYICLVGEIVYIYTGICVVRENVPEIGVFLRRDIRTQVLRELL